MTKIVVIIITNDLAAAEQHLHRAEDFSASGTALPARRLGVHKELGGDIAKTADPD